MGNADSALVRLGRRLAEEQDAELACRGPDLRGRERLLATLPVRRPPARRAALWTAGFAAVAAVIACLWLLAFPGRQPLSFRVGAGADAQPGVPGAFLTTTSGQPLDVTFSDGTRLLIAQESTVRVASVDAGGSRVVLESGTLRASVVHREGALWLVDSGPFHVRVTGTRFEVSWDHAAERFTVHLEEGSVIVTGPLLGDGLAVRAGETLRVLGKQARYELARDAGTPEITSSATARAEAPPPADTAPSVEAPGAPDPSSPPRSPVARRSSFRDLARAGKYEEAFAAARREGIQNICNRGSAADLRELGDAARLAGEPGQAVVALTALRRRFPAGEEAAQAAFLLGVLAFDGRGSDPARWFETYLAERPTGPLAREASGRLIEAYRRVPDRTRARAAAERYLQAYPGGPHADLARAVLAE